jgi:inosine-uridine nucleoside N-ribohydrolase
VSRGAVLELLWAEVAQSGVETACVVLGVALMLEADNDVVGVPDHDHVARGLALSPALRPEIEDIVEVDVQLLTRRHTVRKLATRSRSSTLGIPGWDALFAFMR